MNYKTEHCENCAYYDEQELNAELKRQGLCRRFPPSSSMLQTSQGLVTAVTPLNLLGEHPACGEFTTPVKVLLS